jgi:PAS domain S-box-containing protein
MTTIPQHRIVNLSPGGSAPDDRHPHSPKLQPFENERSVEDRLNLLLDVAHIIPWEADCRTSRFTFVGPQAEQALGYPITEWYEADFWRAHLHPDDRERAIADAARLALTGDHYELEYRMIANDGRIIWLHSVVTVTRENEEPALITGFSIDVTETRQTEAALRDVSGRLINAQEEERSRVARELHDDLSQRMALLSIELEQLGQTMDGSARIRRRFESLQNQAQEISSDIHRLSYRLHPSKLDHLGLAAAIKSLCEQLNAGNLRVYLHQQGFPAALPNDITLCVFRIAQEALRNAVKHSKATHCRVILKRSPQAVQLSVLDDGCGFDVHSTSMAEGLGFVSMRERLRIVGGQLEIHSQPGHGTRIEVSVPLSHSRHTANAGVAEELN